MTNYLNEPVHVFKLWDKEVKEDEDKPIEYKPLDSRYYLLRSIRRFNTINVVSKILTLTGTANTFYRESYFKMPFYDILQEYYSALKQILNKTIIVNADLYLNEVDMVNFDFKKLYYISQLGNYFLVNKINNYVPGRLTRCELVRVIFGELAEPPKAIKIVQVNISGMSILTTFEMTISVDFLVFQYSLDQVNWSDRIFPSSMNPFDFNFLTSGTYYIRIKAGAEYSNVVELPIPSNQIIIP